jgi:hypothetical protein
MRHFILAPLLVMALAGCIGHFKPATGTLQGIHNPVLVGPIDRLGGGKPLATKQVGEYEGQAEALLAQSSSTSGGWTTTTTTDMTDNTGPVVAAVQALAGKGETADIRLSTIRARSYGYLVFIKSRVYLEGSVVLVGDKP